MLEDFLDLMEVRDKGDQAHLGTAFSTEEGIHFEDTADEPRPGRGWFAADRAFPDGHEDKFGFRIVLVLPPLLPPIARAIHTVVIGQALIGCGNMGGQKDRKIMEAGSEETISDGNIATRSSSSGKRAACYSSLSAQEARNPF